MTAGIGVYRPLSFIVFCNFRLFGLITETDSNGGGLCAIDFDGLGEGGREKVGKSADIVYGRPDPSLLMLGNLVIFLINSIKVWNMYVETLCWRKVSAGPKFIAVFKELSKLSLLIYLVHLTYKYSQQ